MADRTVSVRLRAEIGDFVAEFTIAGAAVDAFEKKVDGAGKKTQDGLKKTQTEAAKTTQSIRTTSVSTGSWIASLVGASAGIAAPFAAAGAAAAAFTAVAVPSIVKVVTAQADLNAGWSTLDSRQKTTSAHLGAVITQYQNLAKSYEPQALASFNSLLGDTSVLMQRAKPLLDAGAQGVAGLTGHIDDFVTGGTMTKFLNFAAVQAGPTFDKLGQTFDQTGTLALNLVQDLAPMGQTLLSSANGGLRLLNMVEQINPHLVEFGAAALMLRAPTQALGNLWTNNASKLSKLAKEGSRAEGFLGKLGKTVGSSPNMYIGAALAIGYVTARLATMKDSTDNLISSVRTENGAFGNNVAGHQAAAASLGKYIAQTKAAQQAFQNSATAANKSGKITADQYRQAQGAASQYGAQIDKLTAARKDELNAAHNVTTGESDLALQYGITAQQANQLASAAGVDLSKGITGSGDAARAAQAKIRAYRQAVLDAQNPTRIIDQALTAAGNSTLALKDRMLALTNSFAALAGPELQAMDATVKTAAAFDQFDAAMKKSKGSMSLTTAAGQNAKAAFTQLLATVNQNIDAQYQYDSATKGAAKAAENRTASARSMLPVLLAEAGANKTAQRAILDWANSAGVGKTRTDALITAIGQSKSAFIAAAQGAGKTRGQALSLWAALNKLPAVRAIKFSDNAEIRKAKVAAYQFTINALHGKGVTISDNAPSAAGRINRVAAAINALHNRTVTLTTRHIIETIEIAHRTSQAERAPKDGGYIHRATGGPVARVWYPYGGHVVGAGGPRDDAIPAMISNGEYVINAAQTKKYRPLLDSINYGRRGFADGGYAAGGTVGDIGLSSILSDWSQAVKPSTKAQVNAAIKSRRTQINQLASAEDALARARKRGSSRDIAAAERRIANERADLAAATSKLADVEARYKFAKQSPATQLGSALGMDVKAKAAFIKNLTTLTDRGFGPLAQQLLAMGDSQAMKIAADAVKMSNTKLAGLNKQVGQEQQQQQQLANLPAFLTARAAIKAGQGSSWVGLLNATNLTPDVLAIAIKSMLVDLNKTAAGRSLVADMHAHGYAQGGPIVGRPGVDANLIRATRGEFMVREGPAKKYAPWVEAINQDRLGEFVRHLVSGGSGGGTRAAAHAAPASGPVIHQTFPTQEMDRAELARDVARETAWALG